MNWIVESQLTKIVYKIIWLVKINLYTDNVGFVFLEVDLEKKMSILDIDKVSKFHNDDAQISKIYINGDLLKNSMKTKNLHNTKIPRFMFNDKFNVLL